MAAASVSWGQAVDETPGSAVAPLADSPSRLAEPEIPRSLPPELAEGELSLGWTLVRTLVVLAMVVGLAWLTLNVGLRKLLGIRAGTGGSMVRVLERVALDPRRALFVVEAGGEVLLIGGGEGSLSLLAKLDPGQIEKWRAASPSVIQQSPFLDKLLSRTQPSSKGPSGQKESK
jgi:flagellar biogenesis protein FliO